MWLFTTHRRDSIHYKTNMLSYRWFLSQTDMWLLQVTGYQYGWGAPLPNGIYMNLYFQAPGRWSSGLSMTGTSFIHYTPGKITPHAIYAHSMHLRARIARTRARI